MTKKERIVIGLGGSLIVPDKVDTEFLKTFKKLILSHIHTKQFIIVTGGGRTAREYARAAGIVSKLKSQDKDWLGIHSTHLNGYLIKTIFGEKAYPQLIKNPNQRIKTDKPIIVAAGYKPGCSSDLDAVLIAKANKIDWVINLTNTDYVYDKDPQKYANAKPIQSISWTEFRKIIPTKFTYGMHVPFDPVASKEAQKNRQKVILINGRKTKEVQNYLLNKEFKGTVIY